MLAWGTTIIFCVSFGVSPNSQATVLAWGTTTNNCLSGVNYNLPTIMLAWGKV